MGNSPSVTLEQEPPTPENHTPPRQQREQFGPGRLGGLLPEALTDPDLPQSRHPARHIVGCESKRTGIPTPRSQCLSLLF